MFLTRCTDAGTGWGSGDCEEVSDDRSVYPESSKELLSQCEDEISEIRTVREMDFVERGVYRPIEEMDQKQVFSENYSG